MARRVGGAGIGYKGAGMAIKVPVLAIKGDETANKLPDRSSPL